MTSLPNPFLTTGLSSPAAAARIWVPRRPCTSERRRPGIPCKAPSGISAWRSYRPSGASLPSHAAEALRAAENIGFRLAAARSRELLTNRLPADALRQVYFVLTAADIQLI